MIFNHYPDIFKETPQKVDIVSEDPVWEIFRIFIKLKLLSNA